MEQRQPPVLLGFHKHQCHLQCLPVLAQDATTAMHTDTSDVRLAAVLQKKPSCETVITLPLSKSALLLYGLFRNFADMLKIIQDGNGPSNLMVTKSERPL